MRIQDVVENVRRTDGRRLGNLSEMRRPIVTTWAHYECPITAGTGRGPGEVLLVARDVGLPRRRAHAVIRAADGIELVMAHRHRVIRRYLLEAAGLSTRSGAKDGTE